MGINIKNISINGLRGFSKKRTIPLAIPNGKIGGGLTILVGPNNGGKTTITEAFNGLSKNSPSFSMEKRNYISSSPLEFSIENSNGQIKYLKSNPRAESEVKWENIDVEPKSEKIFVLPSRRVFNPYFQKNYLNRLQYINQSGYSQYRTKELDHFYTRIFKISEEKNSFNEFNKVLKKIIDPLTEWRIDQSGHGEYFIKFIYKNGFHNSDGIGEGILSIFVIVDALYDSSQDDVIVIDEPELSLHPSLQKKLELVLAEYSKDRQIVLSTHSPYFINWDSIENGAKIIRVVSEKENGINIYPLQENIVNSINCLLNDRNNPRILGLESKEIFFISDNIILVEGQEDVFYYKKILKDLNIKIDGDFFGWGVGGASKMEPIAEILNNLGFKKVVGILDGNDEAKSISNKLTSQYKEYKFFCLPTKDIRDKEKIEISKKEIEGIVDKNGNLKEDYKENVLSIFNGIEKYFTLLPS